MLKSISNVLLSEDQSQAALNAEKSENSASVPPFTRSYVGSKWYFKHLESRLALGPGSAGRAGHHFQSTTRVNALKILNNQPSSERVE